MSSRLAFQPSSRLAFQTQLASIMEVLANAAVAEICKLVDDADIQCTVQVQRENKALRRKVTALEMKMMRGSAERRLHHGAMRGGGRGGAAGRSGAGAGGVFDRQMDMGLWPGGAGGSGNQNSGQTHPACIREEAAGVQMGDQALLVKEERMDGSLADVRDIRDIPLIGEDGVVECGPRGVAGRTGVRDALSTSTQSTEHLLHQHQHQNQNQHQGPRSRPPGTGLEVSGSEHPNIPKSEPERVEGTPQHPLGGPNPGLLAPAPPHHPDSEFDMFERASELGAFFDDAESEAEQEEEREEEEEEGGSRPSCSYSGGGGARAGDSSSSGGGVGGGGAAAAAVAAAFHSELQRQRQQQQQQQLQLPLSPGDDHHHHRRLLARKQVVIDVDSEEGEGPLGWEDEGRPSSGQHGSRLQGNLGNMAQPRNLTSVDIALPSTSNVNGWGHGGGGGGGGGGGAGRGGGGKAPPHRTSAREKLFICNFCGKAFNRPKKVEIHQRTHTGEKPFRCGTCGKMFSEAGNLKKHQRVHTGEKPYNCQLCGKGFAWIRNLKTHQEKSHPDVFPEGGDVPCFTSLDP